MSDLLNIGNEIASLWGASCYDYEIDLKNKKVIFDCVEAGEFFITDITFDELKRDYDFNIEEEMEEIMEK